MGQPRELLDPASPAEQAARLRRHRGAENPGTVDIRAFDQGLVETLGAFIEDQRYWLTVSGVDPPPGRPGVLVTFSFPEPEFKAYVVPMILIRRDSIAPALERWHSFNEVFRAPAAGANRVKLPSSFDPYSGLEGYDRMEVGNQAIPYDITYTLSVMAHYRGALGQRGQVQHVLHHVLKTYPPFAELTLLDSLGDPRAYNTFQESISPLDSVPEVAERVIGFAVSMRVEAELDLLPTSEGRTVTQPPTLTVALKDL